MPATITPPSPLPTWPAVTVLMATHDAQPWLADQLSSIAAQAGVRVHVVASDDASSDATPEVLARGVEGLSLATMPAAAERFGNANRNFLRLVADAPIDHGEHVAAFVALSDHDDVWEPRKLSRAIGVLGSTGSAAYSGDVTAFWPDGHRRDLRKAGPQRRWDHLFESAGPGCTFVFTRSAFLELRAWVRRERARLADVKVHDWLFYAHARKAGWRWVIDPEPHMLYRQHERNELGANVGLRAIRSRWDDVRNGKYRLDVLGIAHAIGEDGELIRRLERLGWRDRLWLARRAPQCRRHPPFRWLLALMFLVMRRT
jgi:rhamnosyltransferase